MTDELLRAVLADDSLAFRTSPDWGAGRRHELRLAMAYFARLTAPDKMEESLLDLARLPTHSRIFFSGSHAEGMGGFFASLERPVGFDVEKRDRVSTAVASRIAVEGECAAPSPVALWCAKEAAFKCFANAGIQGLLTSASIRIGGWTEKGGAYRCEAEVRKPNEVHSACGLFSVDEAFGFCFFSLKPNERQGRVELVR